MKKANIITTFVVATTLCLGSLVSVSANTYGDDVKENVAEAKTYKFVNEVQDGKYKLVDTTELKSWIDNGKKMIIVDTMPETSYTTNNGHIPGAINSTSLHKGDTYEEYTAAEKADLTSKIEKLLPTKSIKKTTSTTTWSKVSKKTYKKLSKANRKTKTVKKGKKKVKYYYKKVVKKTTKTTYVKDKSYTIVVYCGFVGCPRSHVAAKYLVAQGYTNVYRYGGGIFAWRDAGYERVYGETPEGQSQASTQEQAQEQTQTDSKEQTSTESSEQTQEQTASEETSTDGTATEEQPAA